MTALSRTAGSASTSPDMAIRYSASFPESAVCASVTALLRSASFCVVMSCFSSICQIWFSRS